MPDIFLSEIDHHFIKAFDLWIRVEYDCSNNTASNTIKHFRTMYKLALNNGWVVKDPFGKYKIRYTKVNRGYLTDMELKAVLETAMPNRKMELVRDMFIFSCYTGISYSDAKNLTKENLQVNQTDHNGWFTNVRKREFLLK